MARTWAEAECPAASAPSPRCPTPSEALAWAEAKCPATSGPAPRRPAPSDFGGESMGGGGVPCTKQSGPPLSRAVGGASMGKVPCTKQSVPPPSAPSEARAWAEADCPSPSGPGPRRPAPVGARAWAGEDRPAPGRPPPGWRAWSLVLPCFAGATLLDPLPCSSDSAGVGLACSLRLGGGVSVRRWQFGVSHPRRGRTRGDQRVRCGESL